MSHHCHFREKEHFSYPTSVMSMKAVKDTETQQCWKLLKSSIYWGLIADHPWGLLIVQGTGWSDSILTTPAENLLWQRIFKVNRLDKSRHWRDNPLREWLQKLLTHSERWNLFTPFWIYEPVHSTVFSHNSMHKEEIEFKLWDFINILDKKRIMFHEKHTSCSWVESRTITSGSCSFQLQWNDL